MQNMHVLFLLLFLTFYNSALLSAEKDDRSVVLKIREQLGNPGEVGTWGDMRNAGYRLWDSWPPNIRLLLNDDGRVQELMIMGLDTSVPFPDAICDLTELEDLHMSDIPGLHGTIPSCVGKLSKLARFLIHNSSISGTLPSFYSNTKLYTIIVTKSHLSGTIPQCLSTLPSLTYLNLSSNYLSGTIPDGLVHGPHAVLDLSKNYLTGELPQCYGWVDFHIIDVSHNWLSGDASFLFGKQKENYMINLSYNDFEFDLSYVEIPQHLYVLLLDHNNIYGKVPDSIVDTETLWWLNLSNNRLCGEIPWGKYLFTYNGIPDADVFSNNICLCGYPLAQCYNSAPAGAPIYLPPYDWFPGDASFPPFVWAPAGAPMYLAPYDGFPGDAHFPPFVWPPAEAPIYVPVPPSDSLP